jgi:hypothetical protein
MEARKRRKRRLATGVHGATALETFADNRASLLVLLRVASAPHPDRMRAGAFTHPSLSTQTGS